MCQLKLGDRLAELVSVHHVFGGLFHRRLPQPAGPPAGLEAPRCETRHLELKAAALACFAPNEVLGGHEIVLEL